MIERAHPQAGDAGPDTVLVIDAGACSGCGLCVIACKDEHVGQAHRPWAAEQPDTGQFWIRVDTVERGRAPRLDVTHLPIACQHCDDAPCITACPDDAIKRRADGLVWIDPEACTGCGDCVPACPFDAVFLDAEQSIAQKCTGCAHRVDAGLQPRCVEICPHDVFDLRGGDGLRGDESDLLPAANVRPRALWRGLPLPYLSGLVVDRATDDVIAGAAIVVVDVDSGVTRECRSDAFGEFRATDLQEGHTYEVHIGTNAGARTLPAVTIHGWHDAGTVRL